MITLLILQGLLVVFLVPTVTSRGRMIEPPQRSSLWRQYRYYPINYDDHSLNCGGYWRHMFLNGGKCGVCGDRWDLQPRPNEIGGKYANGFVSRSYLATDRFIHVTVEVTSSIGGYFEFRLCPNDSPENPVTQECLDAGQLLIKNHGYRYYLRYYPFGLCYHHLKLRIPDNMSCKHCVLQWKWHGRYYWGPCAYGLGSATGCGSQEEYYNCADIEIIGKKTGDIDSTPNCITTGTTTTIPKTTTYDASSYKPFITTPELLLTSHQDSSSSESESDETSDQSFTIASPTEMTTEENVTQTDVETPFTNTPVTGSEPITTTEVTENPTMSSTIIQRSTSYEYSITSERPSTESTPVETTKSQRFSTIHTTDKPSTINLQTDDKLSTPTTVFTETTLFPYTTTSERQTTYLTRKTTLFPDVVNPNQMR